MDVDVLYKIFIPIVLSILSFFAYKVMGMARQVHELWTWYSKTDAQGVLLGYNKGGPIVDELRDHIDADARHMEVLHSKLAALQMQIQRVELLMKTICRAPPFSDDPTTRRGP